MDAFYLHDPASDENQCKVSDTFSLAADAVSMPVLKAVYRYLYLGLIAAQCA